MKYFHLFLYASLLLSPTLAFAQNPELIEQIEAHQATISELAPTTILVGRDEISQTIEFTSPFQLEIVQFDNGRRSKEEKYEVNLAMVERVENAQEDRNGIRVLLRSGNTASFKLSEDGQLKGYEKECAIIASNIENGRAISEALKLLQPLAKEYWEAANALPEDWESLSEYLAEKIVPVSVGGKQYEQSLTFLDSPVGMVDLVSYETDDRNGEAIYHFHFADLLAREVKVDVKGDEVVLSMKTSNRNKFIEINTAEDRSFDDDCTVLFDNFDDALLAAYAIKAIIPLAESKYKNTVLPNYEGVDAALADLNTLISETDLNDYTQSLTTQCLTSYSQVDNSRSAPEENDYLFDFADLDEHKVEIKPSSSAVVALNLSTTSNRKYIGLVSDGERANYNNDLSFYFSTILEAQLARHAVEHLASSCPSETPAPNQSEFLSLLNISGDDWEQEVEFKDDCVLSVRVFEESGKGKETIYELNIYDLQAASGSIDIRGKDIKVVFTTDRKEEIIQVREDDEEQTYTDEIALKVEGLQAGKQVEAYMKILIEGCEE